MNPFSSNPRTLKGLYYLTPTTLVLLLQTETLPTVVGHLLAPVDQHVDVVWVVQRLTLSPDYGERGSDVGGPAQEVNVK